MILMIKFSYIRSLVVAACFLSLVSVSCAQEIKVEARLIWGTDAETNVNYKVENRHLKEELSRIFKWKMYYQITNNTVAIPLNETRPLEMSSKCLLKVKNLGDSRVEVSCFGSGKLVSKGAYSLPDGKWLTLGGADRNENAWFIVMRSRPPKTTAKASESEPQKANPAPADTPK